MSSFNRVILMGNLTRDPEVRHTSGGTAVTDIGLAVNDRRKGLDGQRVDETTFVDVTLWGRTAEVAGEYLSKGSPVLVEGRLKLDTWQANDGGKRNKLKVIGERLQMLGSRNGGDTGDNRQSRSQRQGDYSEPAPQATGASSAGAVSDDDIPF